jgi:hypothetical protein
MVQMPRGAAARGAGSFVEAVLAGEVRAAEAVGVRVVTVSLRRGGVALGVVLGVVIAGAGLVDVALLGELGGGDDATTGEPDDRTPAVTLPGAGAAAGVDGHREPW